MKATILNGMVKDDEALMASEQLIIEKLKGFGWDVETLHLREMKVAGCLGCFGCWLKTPGICVLDDDGRSIAKAVIQSDLVVWLTPVTFGGYSSELKKALDRLIPNVLPYFTRINGEIHHQLRYAKCPDLAVIGIMPEDDGDASQTFIKLAERNAINFRGHNSGACIVVEDGVPEHVDLLITDLLKKVGAIA